MFDRLAALLAAALISASCTPTLTASTASTARANLVPTDQSVWAQQCEKWDEWDKPGPPFRIHGNSYYVGTCGISAILITGDKGHILIDSGTEAGADFIAANIRRLGFELHDIKILLHSHEHFDHVGGHAKMQALTNARVIASVAAARVLGSGIVAASDPQSGMHDPMRKVATNSLVMDGEVVALGNIELTAIETPGHTPGALSWQWRSCDGEDCKSIVYADSLSPVSSDTYRFGDHAEYVGAYRQGLGRIASLDCEILLTPHPSASDMEARLASTGGLGDPAACKRYAAGIKDRLDKRLDDEVKTDNGE